MNIRAQPLLKALTRAAWGVILLLGIACIASRSAEAQLPMYGNFGIHDPSRLIADNGTYYAFGDGQGILILSSTDMRNWTSGTYVFPNGPPAWTTGTVPNFTGYFWAPDIIYTNGQYYLYYAASSWGSLNSAIGLATTPTLNPGNANYLWTDQGEVIGSTSSPATPYNCIDPAPFLDTDGTMWLTFGSFFNGIYIAQLNPATGKLLNTTVTQISSNGASYDTSGEEASFLYKLNGYYYLFVDVGNCCQGVDSTYNIRVGRSKSVTGPYLDKNGVSMLSGGGTVFLESTARYIGPGHAGIFNNNGTYWFTYHYYDGTGSGVPKLAINPLTFGADGWPTVTTDWSALYTFDVDAREHLGLYNGALQNGATVTNVAGRGNVLSLSGSSQYATVAPSVVNASTFSAWVYWNGGNAWQRIFDFGTGTNAYLFLTPKSTPTGNMMFSIKNGGTAQTITASSPLPTNTWCHVAVTLDGTTGIIYVNGASVASQKGMTIRPWQVLATNNYIGKSQFSADPYFSGMIDSVRIYGRPLAPSEIASIATAHPALADRYSFASDAHDSIGMEHGTLMGNATITSNGLQLSGTSGTCVNLPGGLVSGASATTVEAWVTFGTNGNWARLWDFGNFAGTSGTDFYFFSPHSSVPSAQLTISTGVGTETFNASGILDNETVHLVCITNPITGHSAVYLNGIKHSELFHTLPPFNGVASNWAFLGRSLFSSDAWLNATIKEFRIYDGELSPQQITANYNAGPSVLPTLAPTLAITSPIANPATVTGTATRLSLSAAMFNSSAQTAPAITWSKVSGPGSVTFANANASVTSALFSGTGAYVLQCATSSNVTQLNVMVEPSTDPSLALWLKLDDSPGAATAADSSGYGNMGAVTGGLTWEPSGGVVAGTALFDGSTGYVTVPDAPSIEVSNAFTLAFWFRANSLNGAGLVSKRTGDTTSNAFTTFLSSNGRMSVDIGSNANRFASNTVFNAGTWYHVAVVFNGSLPSAQRAALYVNGVLDVSATEAITSVPAYTSSLNLGIEQIGAAALFNGNLDDVRVYNRALTTSEISALADTCYTPLVSAGSPPAATSGVAVSLSGSVTNNLGSTSGCAWSEVSGSGTVAFSNAAAPASLATFGQAGSYVLRLTGSNSAGVTSNDVAVTVTPNPNVYTDWINSYFPGVTDANVVGATADPANDGIPNLMKWALGFDPTVYDAGTSSASTMGIQMQALENVGGANYLSLQVRRPIGRLGVTYTAQVSSDLIHWSAGTQQGAPVSNGDGTETVTFQDTAPESSFPQRFIRLQVSQP